MQFSSALNDVLWTQFGAAIAMLRHAIVACPAQLWDAESKFWYTSYHTIFYLDYYLTDDPAHFAPPAPFGFTELDPAGALPDRVYNKEELIQYLQFCHTTCYELLTGLTEEKAQERFITERRNMSRLETLLYNLRHVQHHVGQLNLLLSQHTGTAPAWVAQALPPGESSG